MKETRCKECNESVREAALRDHWAGLHPEKLQSIDEWLGKTESKLRKAVEILEEQEYGVRSAKK